MGKDVGHKCVKNPVVFFVLAFFIVVASSPNLSTFCFCGCKGTTKNEKWKVKSEKLFA